MKETHDVQAIKDKLTIRALLRHHGIECPEGKKMICSPMRNERTPSFHIDDRKWYDFGGGAGGSVIDLQMHLTDCDVATAIASCAHIAGVSPLLKEDIDGSPLSRVPPPPLRTIINERSPLLSLEKARSLRVNLKDYLSRVRLSYAKQTLMWIPEWAMRDVLRRGWLGANDKGNLVYVMRRGYKIRGVPHSSRGDRWLSGKAKDNLFFSYLDDEDILNPEKRTVILCEGESDSLAATILFGGTCKIAGCLSASIIPPIEMLYPLMRGADRVVLMMDGDEAGRGLAIKLQRFLATNFPSLQVEVFPMPEGKDLKKCFIEGETSDMRAFVLRPQQKPQHLQ